LSALPPKPISLLVSSSPTKGSVRHSEEMTTLSNTSVKRELLVQQVPQKRQRRSGGSEDLMRAVAAVQQLEQEQQSIRAAQRKQLQAQDLDALRQSVIDRSKSLKAQTELEQSFQPRLRELYMLEKLPDTCDALRTLALTHNRSMFSFRQLLPLLETSALVASSAKHSRQSTDTVTSLNLVQCVARYAPAFLCILPPDDVVPVEMVRINLHAPVGQTRQSMRMLQVQAVAEREALKREVAALRPSAITAMLPPTSTAAYALST
jgi:hypothetical protein